jgi:hypothetical protein
MDITQPDPLVKHPLIKLSAVRAGAELVDDDDAPQFRAQLRHSQLETLERLLRWLDQVRREKRCSDELLVAHKRELDALCQDLYERGGWR